MKRMEAELSRRDYEKSFNEAVDEQAKAMAKRIDDEILNTFLKYSHETDSMVSNKE